MSDPAHSGAPLEGGGTGTIGRRWVLEDDNRIVWSVRPGEIHSDHVEMDGTRVAVVVTYGVDACGRLQVSRELVWPLLRFLPNRTRDHLALSFGCDALPRVFVDDAPRRHYLVSRVSFDGILVMEGALEESADIRFRRTLFPCAEAPAVIETVELTNQSSRDVRIEVESNARTVRTNPARGIYGEYIATAAILGPGGRTLEPGESLVFTLVIAGRRSDEAEVEVSAAREEQARRRRLSALLDRLQLETPDRVMNAAFAFSKLRAGESVFATRNGLMHSPGGGVFYAAIWANDQAEYANPYFGYLGDPRTTEAAVNSFRLFARYMNAAYRPIPSAIVAEGANTWHGAGDRGDMAMLAYGIGRFVLPRADAVTARELWPFLEWCLEYCHRKLTPERIVASDSDELENRFPAGKANLCTSSLYFDALESAVMLGRELGMPAQLLADFGRRAGELKVAIATHFGANVAGFETYRYYDGNTVLRSWICVPLTVGLFDRAAGTLDALFSKHLWTADGVLTQAGDRTFWDRTTLYALRAALAAGDVERGIGRLAEYSARRLLGDHVPYPVEAYPEGNQRHLSAESALYGRIFLEGLFGIRPTGFHSFVCRPRLPNHWPRMALRRIHAHGAVFDLIVTRNGESLDVVVSIHGGARLVAPIVPGGILTADLAVPRISAADVSRPGLVA